MAPGTSKNLEGGEKVTLGTDGTIQHAGYWGTHVFDKTGKFLKTISPQVQGMQQQTDPTGKTIQRTLNTGDLSVTQNAQGTTASYDMGPNGVKTAQMKEGPPPGVGPNAMPKSASTAQQPDQDMFTKMLPSMGNKMIDQMAGLAPQLQKTLQDFTPGSPYYEKNVKGNPKLEKAAADALSKAGQFANDPNSLTNYIADIKQRFNQALIPNKDLGRSAGSTEYDRAAQELGLPAVQESVSKNLYEHIEEIENEGPLSSGDYFHIELAEDEGIETWVIAEWTESVLIEADATTLKLLEAHGCTFHDDLTEAEYQGRKVPLGKRMAGDVKKSKVYVKKPNGKVVKVNFGDKKMTIKKSNPKRRKSFRARHNCANPGPRWKARYWSCRAW
jgi:hypothetical protein